MVGGAVAVTPLIPPPVLSKASTPVTKYFDLIAAHSSGPLTVLGSPGLSPAKSSALGVAVLGYQRERTVILVGVGLGVGQRRSHADEQKSRRWDRPR